MNPDRFESNGGGGGGGDIIPGLNEFLEAFCSCCCCWFLGDKVKGEVAILTALESEVDIFENIVNASGKFGGVAGVFAGVIKENPALFFGIAAS